MSELNPKKEAPVAGMEGIGGGATGLLFSDSFTPAEPGQVLFASAGSYQWTVPAGVTSVSVVCIGAGALGAPGSGGGGAGLVYGNNITVTPGATITINVAGQRNSNNASMPENSWFSSISELIAYGGNYGSGGSPAGSLMTAGKYGGNGGAAQTFWGQTRPGGGGGAAGYTGNGGQGGTAQGAGGNGNGDAAGGGGGAQNTNINCRYGGGGGGSGALGHCTSSTPGTGGTSSTYGNPGGNGQGNSPGSGATGYPYGGGAGGINGSGCGNTSTGGPGVVRIMWPGDTRGYPNTNVCDV
tara:strand:- start:463 stop:1353 length:891 start_codon:yes stop_codon:yes gene_type:complete